MKILLCLSIAIINFIHCNLQVVSSSLFVSAFTTTNAPVQFHRHHASRNKPIASLIEMNMIREEDDKQSKNVISTSKTNVFAATTSALLLQVLLPTIAYAVEEDIEIAELPPVWVPIIFAIVILGGVGFLTLSLGDVYMEEASLGLMSGAKAKKEKERSRSSYFKNRN